MAQEKFTAAAQETLMLVLLLLLHCVKIYKQKMLKKVGFIIFIIPFFAIEASEVRCKGSSSTDLVGESTLHINVVAQIQGMIR
jgi:hypothetical protein